MPESSYFDRFVARLGDSEVQAAMRQGFPGFRPISGQGLAGKRQFSAVNSGQRRDEVSAASISHWIGDSKPRKVKSKNASICYLFGVARVVVTEYLPGSLRGRDLKKK